MHTIIGITYVVASVSFHVSISFTYLNMLQHTTFKIEEPLSFDVQELILSSQFTDALNAAIVKRKEIIDNTSNLFN